MSQPEFNPYREWLGIDTESKPTYYQLLGVSAEQLCSGTLELPALEAIARQRIDQLRRVDATGHEELWRRLLRRTKRAAVCLSDDTLRSQYDRRLLREREAERARKQTPRYAPPKDSSRRGNPAIVMKQIKAPPSPSHMLAPAARRLPRNPARRSQLRRRDRRLRAILTSLLLASFGLAGTLYLAVTQTAWGRSLRSAITKTTPAADEYPAADPLSLAQDRQDPQMPPTRMAVVPPSARQDRAAPRHDVGDDAMPVDQPVVSSPVEQRSLHAALRQAKRALGDRNFAQARAALAEAQQVAKRAEDVAMTRRLATLANYVEGYWKAAADGLQQVQAGEELVIDGERVFVVEKTPTRLILRREGRNRAYSLDELPLEMQHFFALRWFDDDAASTQVFRGAVMAVSENPDSEAIRRLWQAAESSGELDLSDLEKVLKDEYELAE